MHTYSTKSNAKAGAVRKLGKDAKEGIAYTLAGSGKEWTWAEIVKEAPPAAVKTKKARAAKKPPRAKRPAGEKPKLRDQARMIQAYAMIERDIGATAEEIANEYHLKVHTVRGMFSRLRSEGSHIHTVREGRKVRYFARKAEASEHAKEISAETGVEAHVG